MATIKRVRLANIIYDNGNKRYNDTIFDFNSEHSIILLQNGLGKTVFIQLVLQAIIPHMDMAGRKIKDTLNLTGEPAHIAVEWVISEKPALYAITAVSLFQDNQSLNSIRYVYQYNDQEADYIEKLPFSLKVKNGIAKRPASKQELLAYYNEKKSQTMMAKTFDTITAYGDYLEKELKISPAQWRKIALINKEEGGMDGFFQNCSTTKLLIDNLLIPVTADIILKKDNQFVETFESQRNNFKINKELNDQINKLKSVTNQMNHYIKAYAKHDQISISCDQAALKVQKIKEHILELINKNEEQLKQAENVELELIEKIRENQYQQLSLKIYQQEIELEQIQNQKNQAEQELKNKQKNYDQSAQKYQNIDISRWQYRLQAESGQVESLSKELRELEQESDIRELSVQREEYLSYIKGYYQGILEILRKKIDQVKIEMDKNKENEQNLKIQEQKDLVQYQNISKQCISLQTKIQIFQENMEKLVEIIALQSEDEIDEIILQINQRLMELQSHFVEIDHQLKALKKEIEEKGKQKEQLNQRKQQLIVEKERGFAQLNEMDKQGTIIRAKILERYLHLRLEDTSDLYLQESKLLAMLTEDKNRYTKVYQENLEKEKVESRLYSLYRESQYFMADPLVENIITKLQSQLSDAISGTKYFQDLIKNGNQTEIDLYQKYPFWAITIIVNSTDLERAQGIIQTFDQNITNQIIVLSKQELKIIIENGESNEHTMVLPKLWQENLKIEPFEQWKSIIKNRAEIAKQDLIAAEEEVKHVEEIKQQLEFFYIQNSYEQYQDLKSKQFKLENEINQLGNQLNDLQVELIKLPQNVEKLEKEKKELQEEYDIQKIRVEKSKEYKELQQELNIVKQQLEKSEYSSKTWAEKLKNTQKQIKDNIEALAILKEEYGEYQQEILLLQEKEWFKKSSKVELAYTNQNIETLIRDCQVIEDRLKGISNDRNSIETQLIRAKKEKEIAEKEMERLTQEARYPVEIIPILENENVKKIDAQLVELSKRKQEYQKLIEELKIKIQELEKQAAVALHEKEKQEAELKAQGYTQRYIFTKTIGIESERLEKEKKSYQKQEADQKKRKKQLMENMKEDQDLQIKLGYAMAEHHKNWVYRDKSRYTIDLGPELLDYEYNKNLVVKRVVDDLKKGYEVYQQSVTEIQKELNCYTDYCNQNIVNPSLKESCIHSIASCENYENLQNVQNNIKQRLQSAIKISTDSIRESEADLQIFLSHLTSFCSRILDEIKSIQAKTKIKTKISNKYEFIYEFTMPKYEEEEAKQAIRNYLDRLIEKYDQPDWQEKTASDRRKVLQKDLSATQLLWKSLGDQTIRIRCRKVSNRTELSRSLFEWETSQKWSGGEGWSKNMALFLAILNYIEEKKIINQSNGKCVILDNPFGKASSDHVLYPIFEIANKLGYQIIALTAHAEGKFISDFFPVVYSGIGRDTLDHDSAIQILDFEKQSINTAYLRQKDFNKK